MADFDFNTLITDRSQADVDYLSELAARIVAGTASADDLDAFASDLRGAYNAGDMNRVGQAVAALVQELEAIGVPVTASPKTDWAVGDIPTPEQLTAYLADVAAVCAALPLPEEAPTLPESMDALNFEGANAIEGALLAVKAAIDHIKAAFSYSGTMCSGMVNQFISGGTLQ